MITYESDRINILGNFYQGIAQSYDDEKLICKEEITDEIKNSLLNRSVYINNKFNIISSIEGKNILC